MNNNNMNPGPGTGTETYYPKALARFSTKAVTSLTLKSIALDATLKLLCSTSLGSGSERDARGKKMLRSILEETLPAELQMDLIHKGVEKWFGANRMLNLLDIFQPKRTIKDTIDMIGSFRYAYGCYFSGNKLYWSNGTIERLNLNVEQCNRLHQYVSWSDALKKQLLRTVVISTERGALRRSHLPNIFARATSLTRVTILNGATNHVLCILGKNCPSLRLLDVSHSNAVNDSGIAGLLLRNLGMRHKIFDSMTLIGAQNILPWDKNGCASTLCKLILIGTDVSPKAFNLACVIMGHCFYVAFLPDLMIVRPMGACRVTPPFSGVSHISATVTSEESLHPIFGQDENILRKINRILGRFVERRKGTEETLQILDHYPIPERSKGDRYAQNFIRGVDSFLTEAMMVTQFKDNQLMITQLILFWDSFTWSVTGLPDLTELGTNLPNLTLLKARIQGSWERTDALFPFLEETYIWTVSDNTVLSFLRSSPKIKILKFNCLDLIRFNDETEVLTDFALHRALSSNQLILKSLTEICIRPASHLHIGSARFLLRKAKGLRRLGDMESWKVSPAEIKILNEELDRANSKCVLTVLSFPPHLDHEYLI